MECRLYVGAEKDLVISTILKMRLFTIPRVADLIDCQVYDIESDSWYLIPGFKRSSAASVNVK